MFYGYSLNAKSYTAWCAIDTTSCERLGRKGFPEDGSGPTRGDRPLDDPACVGHLKVRNAAAFELSKSLSDSARRALGPNHSNPFCGPAAIYLGQRC